MPTHKMLGKTPKKHDARNLLMSRYLLPELPKPLAAMDHYSKLPANIGMMGNDKYGDCTIAAAAHAVQEWTLYAGKPMQTIPDSAILSAYKTLSPRDQGCAMLDVLNYWRKTGVGGEKIEAFIETATGDLTQAKLAIELFGSHYIGMSLPRHNTEGPWTAGHPRSRPDPYLGHCVVLLGYDDATKMFKAATWGEVVDMSYGWFRKYVDESYAILDNVMLSNTGKSPEGFDWAALQDDLAHIHDPVT